MNDQRPSKPTDESRPQWRRLDVGALLRGRFEEVPKSLDQAGRMRDLPPRLRKTVLSIVRRTRLRRREKWLVAEELSTRFANDLASGRSEVQLIAELGDGKQVAKRIRRSKLRDRSVFSRVLRRLGQIILVASVLLSGFWGVLWLRLRLAKPTIRINYVARLDELRQAIPETERAWPIYRNLMLSIPEVDWNPFYLEYDYREQARAAEPFQIPDAIRDWIDSHPDAITKIREGASRRHFGLIYDDPANNIWYGRHGYDEVAIGNPPNGLADVILVGSHFSGRYRSLLDAHVRIAVGAGSSSDVVADLRALLGMGEQLLVDQPFLIDHFYAWSYLNCALQLTRNILAKNPEVLDQHRWLEIQEAINGFGGGGPLQFDFTGEAMFFQDSLQREYTDNGSGDGRMTDYGVRLMFENAPDSLFASVVRPIVPFIVQSRVECTDAILELHRRNTEEQRTTWIPCDAIVSNCINWKSLCTTLREEPSREMFHRLEQYINHILLINTERDATIVAIALVLFHQDTGEWPERLEELTPKYVAAIPTDPADGQPIRYRVVDGRPLIYSIGADRHDHQGQNPRDFEQHGGDWVLFPIPVEVPIVEP